MLPMATAFSCRYGALAGLSDEQRDTLRAPASAAISISLIRPTSGGALPMRRIFEDQQGNQIEQLDLWKYGYDARKRPWYLGTIEADRPVISSPYVSFSIGAPVITVSAPLRGTVHGVIAADLKLDNFSDFVNAQRPGAHGTAVIFDSAGTLLAHPDFAQFVATAQTHPSHPATPQRQGHQGRIGGSGLEGVGRSRPIQRKHSG